MGAKQLTDSHPTVSSGYLRSVYYSAKSFGLDENKLRDILGAPENTLEMRTYRFPYETLMAIYEYTADALNDPAVGLRFGRNVRAERRIDTIYATTFCRDLEQAIQLNIDYQPLIHTMGRTRLSRQGNQVVVGFDPAIPYREGLRIFMDAIFTSYASVGQWLAWSMQSLVTEMRFQQPRPEDMSLYEKVFRCDLKFNAQRTEMVVPEAAIEMLIPGRNPELITRLKPALDKKMALLNRPFDLSDEIKTLIEGNLKSGKVNLAFICSQLNMSERTLRRKLNETGLNFGDLLKSVRAEQASIYMLDNTMSLADIAHELGFGDQSAFSRAFKTWTSETPKAFRERELGHV